MPIIYNYDAFGCFVSASEARIDPLETAKTGVDVFLLPAMATYIAPEVECGEGEALHFTGDGWEVIPDYRGMIAYQQIEPFNVEIVSAPGELRPGWALTPPDGGQI